jgi:hypothetical protein
MLFKLEYVYLLVLYTLQPGLDLNNHLSAKGKILLEKNAGAFGPHVLVLSDDERDVAVYAVVQGNLFYEAPSVLDALDICVKAAFVFGLSYPAPARSSWTLVQKLLYGITSEADYNSTRLAEMMLL